MELGSNARRWPTDRATEREAYRLDPGIVLHRTKTRRTFPLACMYAPVERGGRRKNRKRGKKDETAEGCGKYWKGDRNVGASSRQIILPPLVFTFRNVRVQRVIDVFSTLQRENV